MNTLMTQNAHLVPKELILVILAILILSIDGFACSCPPPMLPAKTDEQQRELFLNEFKGAAFIGKIVKAERVRINWKGT